MSWIRSRPFLLALLLLGCGSEAFEGGDMGRPPLGQCAADADCPDGLLCEEGVCVADDGLPPELPVPERTHLPPAASKTLLWTLSKEASRVTAIDPSTLSIRSFSVASEPVHLAPLPGEDSALVLSRFGATLSLIEMGRETPRVLRQPLERRLSTISLSADGRWALLWNPAGAPLDTGLEGLVLLVDVESIRSGGEASPFERMVGRRPSQVFFRMKDGVAAEAVVLSKEEVAIFDLGSLPSLPERIPLGELHREPTTRRVAFDPIGGFLLVGSITTPDLAVIDVEARRLDLLPLPGPPSDIQVFADGPVVTVLRTTGQVAWFPMSGTLPDPGSVQAQDVSFSVEGCKEDPCNASPGQARLGEDGKTAYLFTNAAKVRAFARLHLDTGEMETFQSLRKHVRDLLPSPGGDRVIVLHAPDPKSTLADEYEKSVDQSEGYSVVDLRTGAVQLRLTEKMVPERIIHAAGERFAAVVLRLESKAEFLVDAIDLESLVPFSLPLPSSPEDAGPLTHEGRIWVSQRHPQGRISFVDLGRRSLETITGFDFNGRIE